MSHDPKDRDRHGQQGTQEPWKNPGQKSQDPAVGDKDNPTGRKPPDSER